MEKKTQTIKPVDTTPEVKVTKEEKVNIFIDPEMVGKQGIQINGKMFIGHVSVPKGQADDLLRIQDEYWETIKKMKDPLVSVRMKNDFQKERLFLADPAVFAGKANFTRDYGLLGQREWNFCTDKFKEYLLDVRKSLYGY